MSWVQSNAPPPTLPQQQSQHSYPQQQKHLIPPVAQQQQPPLNLQQQQQHLATQSHAQPNTVAATNAYTNPAPPLPSNLASTTSAYMSKPINVNNNIHQSQQHNSMRSQMHANGGTHQQPQQPGNFSVQQQQQQPSVAANAWQQQPYAPPNKMMQSNAAAANKNWPQQQQQQQTQNASNLYPQPQQQQTTAPHNIWQPPDLPTANNVPPQQQQQQAYPHPTTYDNYFTANHNQGTQQQPPAQTSQYQQPPQQVAPDAANYFHYQQQQPTQMPQPPPPQQPAAAELFDNSNANNRSDGWGDWDWNDNGNVVGGEVDQTPAGQQASTSTQLPIHKPAVQQQVPPLNAFDAQPTNYNAPNVIEESFGAQSNDNWSWNIGDDVNANAHSTGVENESATITPQVPTTNNRQAAQVPRQVASSVQVPQQKAAEYAVTDANDVRAAAATAAAANVGKPASLPLSETTNENYNTTAPTHAAPPSAAPPAAVGVGSNIPNSVYVSQAKPVSRPSRQYASPPGVASPTSEPLDNALTPPQAFQNEVVPIQPEIMPPTAPPAGVATIGLPLQNPPPALSSPSNLPPPPGATATAGNPFKRAGAAQHHRGVNIAAPPTAPQQITAGAVANAFAVPPPPADFANPLLNHLEPDNSEILHENQEVLGTALPIPPTSLLLPTTQTIVLPGAAAAEAPPPPPPNDERNQYLQTSPLSENPDEELNLEADSLPPPGLSRLVLGQPELLEATQRMVTGTEEPANMHMDERHADGEDTSLEQVPAVTLLNASQRGALGNATNLTATSTPNNNSNTIDITTDRNLYLVPGESNISNEQRVVTGVERSPESNAPAPPPQIASGQREIELDGENLEDQQQEQQHQQQQPPLLTVNSRDEPPLEGAAATNEPSPPTVDESQDVHHHHHVQHHHHHHHSTKSKELSNASTGNDESDPLPEHQHHHHATRHTGAGSNKSRKHSIGELERKVPDRQQRRDKQRNSADRYESDDFEGSEPYSSDRERERERDRRRGYREGSVRSDREREERDYGKDKRRRAGERADKRDERDKLRDKYYTRDNGKSDTLRRSGRYNRQYDDDVEDVSARRKEQSRRGGARHHNDERAGRSDRSERDYDDYNRRPRGAPKRGEKIHDEGRDVRRSNYVDDERREQRRTRRDRGSDYDTIERRHRGAGGDKSMRGERADLREYEEYRKQSSRNARDSDLEKERARYDPRHAAMYGYPPGAYGYDPYATYYYEQMARTNPQAYSEWYKKYYGHAAAATASSLSAHAAAGGDHVSLNSSSLAAVTADGRESVHSGRSSVQNENDRYTQAYISQANEYHRHLQQRQLHSQQQQQQQHMIYSQQHTNMSLNSTTLDDFTGSMYGTAGEALRAARSTSNLSQIGSGISAITGGGVGGVSLTAYYAGVGGVGAAYYARSDYAESRSGHLSLRDAEAIAEPDPQRLTPRKFVNEHSIVSLSAGILVTVKPKYTSHGAISNIVKLQRLGANDATRQLFQTYPGPLVRGLTHKKTIIEFCEEQIRLGPMETTIYAKQLVSNNIEKYRGSYTLMWNLLILLLRQNGMVVGTDIAELLLKNQQQFPYQIEHTDGGDSSALSGDEADEQQAPATDSAVAEQNNTELDSGNEAESVTNSSKQAPKSTTTISNIPVLNDDEITEKFRNYLLYGNVNEALDWATDNNLWGHALFLASKVDRRSHANVMTKFANKLSLNDPLQTLYQLMSGRQPSSVTSVQDEKWGDWRPHLSMILSNTSQKPELDRKSITTLGDSLLNRGDLFAAHFCYLMAQVGFGRYQECATLENTLQQHLPKLVLLGSSHYKYFNDFAANEAIMMTEIYEYACSLNDDKFSLVEFQPYKYLLATRLLDYGYNLRSLMYFEQIALHIQRDPCKYEPSFINKIYDFADRLKYYDPVLERSMDDQQHHTEGGLNSQLPNFEEQKWLQDLRALAVQHKNEYTSPAAPVYGQIADTQSQIDQQFVEINKQFNELNLQYQGLGNVEQTPTPYNPDTMQQQQQQPHNDIAAEHYNQQQTAVAGDYNSQQPSLDSQAPNHVAGDASYAYYNQQQQYMQSIDAQQQPPQQQEPHSIPYYDPTQQQQHYQGYGAEAVDAQNNAAAYDYWAQENQQQQQTQHAGYGDEHAANDDEPAIGITKTTLKDTAKNVEAYLNNDDMLALKQMPLQAKSQTTTTYKTTLESLRKLQQPKDKPLEITAAAAKLYNSYDGPQTRVAKKANTNHNNNNNNAKQQQHAATLTTSFLSVPPDNARPIISMPKSKIYDAEDDKQQQQKANANDVGKKLSEQKGGKSEAGKETQKKLPAR
ncbi:PREDICTED: COPII coat assembly protein sec16 isoform X2 [Bactrocera latifrons]|uniref:COPII coat assembly protein sec16 isoform X2 n=1 Tax=Bactrocera latifrons TaxID=174628 RepID=UPI0008DE2549|nr:PREDICTED: COPII coat assembly protein sec16 isoform X2 [Bactrocera latifrons]